MQQAFMVGGKMFVLLTVQIDIHFEKTYLMARINELFVSLLTYIVWIFH